MLVDAGDGVVGQLLAAGIPLESVQEIAFTHMHWDHILGYPAFIWGSWNMGRTRLDVTGPSGTQAMHDQLVESYYREQAEWAIDLGFPRAGFDGIEVRDVGIGWSRTLEGCLIETGPVHHPPMAALAYRFTYKDRCLVISGDTARCDELVDFARGCDVFLVDACAFVPPGDLPAERRRILERLHEFHATPQECVDMAALAAVPTVVLTHHLPGVEPQFDTSRYTGKVIVGRDLELIAV
jgi:ribonuclease Z